MQSPLRSWGVFEMKAGRRVSTKTERQCVPPLFRLWILRMLLKCGGLGSFLQPVGFMDERVAEALGLSGMDSGDGEFSPTAARAALRKQLAAAEAKADSRRLPAELSRNADRLGRLIGLDKVAQRILSFAVLIKTDTLLNSASALMGSMPTLRTLQAVSTILDLPQEKVKSALAADSPLANSGLLRIERSSAHELENKFNILSTDFAEAMLHDEDDPLKLLSESVRAAAAGTLSASDYRHLGDHLPMLQTYLRHALATRRKGVNILLYGPPGTGKSELARLLAQQVNAPLMEVVCADADGKPIDGERRLNAYRTAQWIFAQQPALILFDEIEDVFNDAPVLFEHLNLSQARKGWFNNMLEQNPVPALWLTNSVTCLDAAFIRRFDLVVEVPVPPKAHRKAILAKTSGGLLNESVMARLSQLEHMPPAVVARAAEVTRIITRETPVLSPVAVMERLIDGTLKAQGQPSSGSAGTSAAAGLYDPAFTRADIDLIRLADGLKASGGGRICLYGPPGTGKTGYGQWLAEQLGKRLILKRGSDLLSMYVGGTEKAIAEAFAQAREDGAILMIDEIDGFLQDRRCAQRNWELTQVNEMLTQMEDYDGILMASTNLMTGMDQAALRRFDVKARFDYLLPDQAFGLLRRHCASLAIPSPGERHRAMLHRLGALTPGDFAAIARRCRFTKLETPDAWITALEEECAFKDTGQPRIGFQ